MEAYHNSRDLKFRAPFGAVPAGQEIDFSIDIWGGVLSTAELRVWNDGKGETRVPMAVTERPGGYTASVKFTPDVPDLYWYRFDLTDSEGNVSYYGPETGRKGGAGSIYSSEYECPSYQITVSRERKSPSWYKNGIVYQIFPDRFARESGKTDEELAERISGHKTGPKRRLVKWDKPVSYEKKKDGSIAAWDFYGGSLNGIIEKLPYLMDLGVTVLYLNPIFEAASNHRYDTGDYSLIDPLLGTEEDFARLCAEAEKRGISVILDGVFNHTGCDSIYFNKYGNYDSTGAYQSEKSEYRDWYSFNPDVPDGYDSWWGVGDLPNIREDNADYQKFIYSGKNAIVRKWMKLGAKGWRLDVADELPDSFIAGIKKAMLEEAPDDALLMGEVWEDASNKESYGVKRKYFQGEELDCVMNYPFRDGICRFLTGKCTAEEFTETLYTLLENYPKEAFYSNLNLIGSHDRMRIFSILGEAPAAEGMTEAEKKSYHMDGSHKNLAKARLWLASLIQMTMPGVPCIYYGDEAGMEGYTDPYNRGAYPWGREDADCRTIYKNVIGLRKSHRIFTEGSFIPFASGEDVIGFTRKLGNETVTVLINRSTKNSHTVTVPNSGEYAADLISGKIYSSAEPELGITLGAFGSAVIYFSPEQRLGEKFEKGTGVLCHITSLPNGGKPGVIGPQAFRFLDLLKEHGEKYWQILPLNPVDQTGSPYAGFSAFAGNLSLLPYTEKELKDEYKTAAADAGNIMPASAYDGSDDGYGKFLYENSAWVDGYAMFMAVKDANKGTSWRSWPKKYSTYSDKLWNTKKLAEAADFYRYCQYVFEKSWTEVRNYAKSLGIKIIGDMPMYVSEDSADAWQYTGLFAIEPEESQAEELVAGVPPDYFSAEGQLWGNPLYRWDVMKKDGYSWWMKRFKRAFDLYDIVRLDHFRGFEAYWAIPKGQKALCGNWRQGPGRDIFEKAYKEFGPLPIIAEDLGFITPGVRSLVMTTGFPGMDIMQFADTDPRKGYTPAPDRIAYTGTHDNETLLGWCKNRYKAEAEALSAASGSSARDHENDNDGMLTGKKEIAEAAAADGYSRIAEELLNDFYKCPAFIRIVPLQDLLGLDNSARMNAPGTVGTNWKWQAEEPLGWSSGQAN